MKKQTVVTKTKLTKKVVRLPAKIARTKPAGSSPKRPFPVIAMATSVGGLAALSVILSDLPAEFPAAIAIVMHLSPKHKSILAEILSRRTHLEVKQAHTGDVLRPSWVFIAPPNHHLSVGQGGRLKLSSPEAKKVHYARPSAEPLFASVAAVYQKDAIAVVLTGGDGDGSFGVQIIKDEGGKVIAQDRPTSVDFSMPETSINTGDVDFILPLDEIAAKLVELVSARTGTAKGRTRPQKIKILGASAEALAKPVAGEGARAPVIPALESRRPRRGLSSSKPKPFDRFTVHDKLRGIKPPSNKN